MKKKAWLLTVVLLLVVCVGVVAAQDEPEAALAPMAMVDGTLWQISTESAGGLSRKPDSTIREIIGNKIPTKEGQANFGTVGMPCWKLTDGLMVYVNGNYFIMKAFQE